MAGLNITSTPGVDWGQVAQAVNLSSRIQADDEAAKANAIRWQGQQDYQALVDSGVTPEDALRRTAHKLYFNEPSGVASLLRATKKEEPWSNNPQDFGENTFLPTSRNSGQWQRKQGEQPKPYELMPGVWAIDRPTGGVQIIKQPDTDKPETVTVTSKPEFGAGDTVTQKITRKEYEAKEAEKAAAKKAAALEPVQALFNKAKARVDAGYEGFFGGNVSDMLGSSNTLAQAGIDPNNPAAAISKIEAALAPKTAPGASVKPPPTESIPGAAIKALRENPSRAAEFDEIFGAGSAAQFLKK
jgi:hypothetical protein